MSTPGERQEWLQDQWAGRQPVFPLVVTEGSAVPIISVWQVAEKDAQTAFVAGLFVASILAAFAACEIYLADRVPPALAIADGEFPAGADEWISKVQDSERETEGLQRLSEIIRHFKKGGQRVSVSVLQGVRDAGRERNNYAHFRPLTARVVEILPVEVGSGGEGYAASVEVSEYVRVERQEESAKLVLAALIDLRCAEITFSSGTAD